MTGCFSVRMTHQKNKEDPAVMVSEVEPWRERNEGLPADLCGGDEFQYYCNEVLKMKSLR